MVKATFIKNKFDVPYKSGPIYFTFGKGVDNIMSLVLLGENTKVIKVIVNESEGKKPEQYVIKDININLQNLTVAQKTNSDFAANPATGLGGTGGGSGGGGGGGYTVPSMPYNTTGSRFTLGQSESAIDAKHIVHLSLTEGLDRFWPFGQSL